jgi:hypothetical protein
LRAVGRRKKRLETVGPQTRFGPFSRLLVQSPESAARELVATLRKRRSLRLITGFATRQLVRLQQLVSRKTAINMMGRSSPL